VSRIPRFDPNRLDERQRRLYAAIVGGRAEVAATVPLTDEAGHLAGPFNAMLLSPDIGMALQELGTAIRYRTVLSPRSRELAILVVAAHWQCEFELDAHTLIGAQAGLTGAELDALRAGAPLWLRDDEEAAVLAATRSLVRTADMGPSEYDAAATALGTAKLFEVSALVGYYSLLALQMRIFRVSRALEPGTSAPAENSPPDD
jgi:4-carboxymuconolactone decarboxylase